jgi:anti-sigma regulatory factor (Ser/Thr protein kinase)
MLMVRADDNIALVPSPLPAQLAVSERMVSSLRDAALTVRERTMAGNATEIDAHGPDHMPRMMFVDPSTAQGTDAGPLHDPPPVEFLLEIPDDTPAERLATWADEVRRCDVYWSLTTESAMRMTTPSRAFACAVVRMLGREHAQDLLMRIETALHETVANALVHGNLRLPSLSQLEGDDQSAAYQQAVQAGLANPDLAERRVTLRAYRENGAVRLQVEDEGDGVPDEHWHNSLTGGESALTQSDKSGRGLYITAMFCDDLQRTADGRTVQLSFELEEAPA